MKPTEGERGTRCTDVGVCCEGRRDQLPCFNRTEGGNLIVGRSPGGVSPLGGSLGDERAPPQPAQVRGHRRGQPLRQARTGWEAG